MKKNRWFNVILVILLIGIVLSGCASAATTSDAYYEESVAGFEYDESEAPAEYSPMRDESGYYDDSYNVLSKDQSQIPEERLVIKNADLVIVVEDPSGSMDEIARVAEEMGGFVVSANLFKTETTDGVSVPQASISIRVPSERLNDALDEIKSESDQEPLSEGISSQDVTGEYVDLQSQLTNLEATEVKLRQIMDEAEETEDVLAVYNELVQVRGQIEVIKGRMKYLQESAALSSIHTELMADEAVQPLTVGSWQPTGVAKGAVQALINALKFLVNLAIWLVIFVLPVLLVIGLFVLIIFFPLRWLIRRIRGSNMKSPKASVENNDPPLSQEG